MKATRKVQLTPTGSRLITIPQSVLGKYAQQKYGEGYELFGTWQQSERGSWRLVFHAEPRC